MALSRRAALEAALLRSGDASNLTRFQRLRLFVLLGSLTAFGPLSIDMYLPALPAIAPSAWLLVLLRLIQGLTGAAGIVIARAIVRDLYSGSAAARYFSRLILVMGLAPILAPVLGAHDRDSPALARCGAWPARNPASSVSERRQPRRDVEHLWSAHQGYAVRWLCASRRLCLRCDVRLHRWLTVRAAGHLSRFAADLQFDLRDERTRVCGGQPDQRQSRQSHSTGTSSHRRFDRQCDRGLGAAVCGRQRVWTAGRPAAALSTCIERRVHHPERHRAGPLPTPRRGRHRIRAAWRHPERCGGVRRANCRHRGDRHRAADGRRDRDLGPGRDHCPCSYLRPGVVGRQPESRRRVSLSRLSTTRRPPRNRMRTPAGGTDHRLADRGTEPRPAARHRCPCPIHRRRSAHRRRKGRRAAIDQDGPTLTAGLPWNQARVSAIACSCGVGRLDRVSAHPNHVPFPSVSNPTHSFAPMYILMYPAASTIDTSTLNCQVHNCDHLQTWSYRSRSTTT